MLAQLGHVHAQPLAHGLTAGDADTARESEDHALCDARLAHALDDLVARRLVRLTVRVTGYGLRATGYGLGLEVRG